MNLSELKPQEAKLKLTTVGREYILRPVSLEDELWLQSTFGENLADIFEDVSLLSKVVFRLIKDKSDFKQQEVTVVDENGLESIEYIGGVKLLQRMIHGLKGKHEMVLAFNETLGISRPDPVEEEENQEEDSSKKKDR